MIPLRERTNRRMAAVLLFMPLLIFSIIGGAFLGTMQAIEKFEEVWNKE